MVPAVTAYVSVRASYGPFPAFHRALAMASPTTSVATRLPLDGTLATRLATGLVRPLGPRMVGKALNGPDATEAKVLVPARRNEPAPIADRRDGQPAAPPSTKGRASASPAALA